MAIETLNQKLWKFFKSQKWCGFDKNHVSYANIWTSAARTGSPRWTGMSSREPVLPRFFVILPKNKLIKSFWVKRGINRFMPRFENQKKSTYWQVFLCFFCLQWLLPFILNVKPCNALLLMKYLVINFEADLEKPKRREEWERGGIVMRLTFRCLLGKGEYCLQRGWSWYSVYS